MFRPSDGDLYALETVRKYKLVLKYMDWYYVINIALLQYILLLLLLLLLKVSILL